MASGITICTFDSQTETTAVIKQRLTGGWKGGGVLKVEWKSISKQSTKSTSRPEVDSQNLQHLKVCKGQKHAWHTNTHTHNTIKLKTKQSN